MTRIVDELFFLVPRGHGRSEDGTPAGYARILAGRHSSTSLPSRAGRKHTCHSRPRDAGGRLGDELRLREFFLNLVDNAIKYSRPGGNVEISLTTHLNQAKLVITDQGIGISPEDQKTDLRPLFPHRRCPRPHEKRHRPGARHLRVDRRVPSWAHRGAKRAEQGLDVYGNPAAGDFTLLKTFNTLLIGLSFLLVTVLCRDFRLPCRMFHVQSLSLSISKEDL